MYLFLQMKKMQYTAANTVKKNTEAKASDKYIGIFRLIRDDKKSICILQMLFCYKIQEHSQIRSLNICYSKQNDKPGYVVNVHLSRPTVANRFKRPT